MRVHQLFTTGSGQFETGDSSCAMELVFTHDATPQGNARINATAATAADLRTLFVGPGHCSSIVEGETDYELRRLLKLRLLRNPANAET